MAEEIDLSFEFLFKIPIFALKANGSYPGLVRDRKWIVMVICLLIKHITFFCLVTYSVIQTTKEKDYNESCKTGYMCIMSFMVLLKYSILVAYKPTFVSIIDALNRDYQLAKQASTIERNVVVEYAKKGQWLCLVWLILSLVSGVMFPFKACLLMVVSYFRGDFKPEFVLQITNLPVIQSLGVNIEYVLTWFWQLLFASFATVMYIGFEATGPIFILHACGQMELVQMKVANFYSVLADSRGVNEKMAECVKLLQKVYRLIKKINSIYTAYYELMMKISTCVISIGSFLIRATWKDSFSIEFILLTIAGFTQVYIPCYYSDLLMDKGERVRQALYECDWESFPNTAHRKTLLILMVRATRPPLIRSFFTIMCLDAFADMARQAFTLLNMMNVAWN